MEHIDPALLQPGTSLKVQSVAQRAIARAKKEQK